jgi:hypothetical protein
MGAHVDMTILEATFSNTEPEDGSVMRASRPWELTWLAMANTIHFLFDLVSVTAQEGRLIRYQMKVKKVKLSPCLTN